jgi:peptide/nickel transport system ATP-binding protein
VVSRLADDIAVMYAGRIVEQGPIADVIEKPRHHYTAGLIASVPSRNRRGERLQQIQGMPPNVLTLPEGCAFRTRCPAATDLCRRMPELTIDMLHGFRCHYPLNETAIR